MVMLRKAQEHKCMHMNDFILSLSYSPPLQHLSIVVPVCSVDTVNLNTLRCIPDFPGGIERLEQVYVVTVDVVLAALVATFAGQFLVGTTTIRKDRSVLGDTTETVQ